MDYKTEIIKLIKSIENPKILKFLYLYIKDFIERHN